MNSYITPQVCAQWPRDDDWPTWDPHHAVPAGAKTFADAVRSRLVNKTVVFIGDSVGAQVFIAALCEAARGGLAPVETTVKLTLSASEAPLPEHITRRLAAIRKVTTDTPVEAWIGGPPRLPWLVEETGTLLVSKGWHKWGRADMTPLLGFADVILVNYGLHYLVELQGGGVTTEYDEALREFFAQVAEFAATPGKARCAAFVRPCRAVCCGGLSQLGSGATSAQGSALLPTHAAGGPVPGDGGRARERVREERAGLQLRAGALWRRQSQRGDASERGPQKSAARVRCAAPTIPPTAHECRPSHVNRPHLCASPPPLPHRSLTPLPPPPLPLLPPPPPSPPPHVAASRRSSWSRSTTSATPWWTYTRGRGARGTTCGSCSSGGTRIRGRGPRGGRSPSAATARCAALVAALAWACCAVCCGCPCCAPALPPETIKVTSTAY